jgi:hypothetical protein
VGLAFFFTSMLDSMRLGWRERGLQPPSLLQNPNNTYHPQKGEETAQVSEIAYLRQLIYASPSLQVLEFETTSRT